MICHHTSLTQTSLPGMCDQMMFSQAMIKEYNDETSWFRRFRNEVTALIDPTIFDCLYSAIGAPSIDPRYAIAFLVLKEANNFTYDQMYDAAVWDPRFRVALGLDEGENAPARKSVFNFWRRNREYTEGDKDKKKGEQNDEQNAEQNVEQNDEQKGKQKEREDLIDKAFKQLVKALVQNYGLEGGVIRMDSKLLGTNIANMGRLQIVQETLSKEMKRLEKEYEEIPANLNKEIQEVLKTDADKFVYHNNSEGVKARLDLLGRLSYNLIKACKLYEDEGNLLVRVFCEQYNYKIVDNEYGSTDEQDNASEASNESLSLSEVIAADVGNARIEPKKSKDISAQSVQYPNDPDATYRKKNDQSVKGISANVTETIHAPDLYFVTNFKSIL